MESLARKRGGAAGLMALTVESVCFVGLSGRIERTRERRDRQESLNDTSG